jgi:hypothetical protein
VTADISSFPHMTTPTPVTAVATSTGHPGDCRGAGDDNGNLIANAGTQVLHQQSDIKHRSARPGARRSALGPLLNHLRRKAGSDQGQEMILLGTGSVTAELL